MDSFDRQILEILQRDSRMSRRQVGNLVHLSAAAVHRRIAALEARGIITSYVAITDPDKLGRMVTAIVDVTVESEQLPLLDELKRHFRSVPEVQQCYYVTGDTDFVLVVTAPTMVEYEEVTRRLFFSQKNVKTFRTRFVMGRVKAGLSIPVSAQKDR